jgi:hypothetical protein
MNYEDINPLNAKPRRRTIYLSIYLSMALQPFIGASPIFQFLDLFTESVGLLGWGISPSQGRYLHTG